MFDPSRPTQWTFRAFRWAQTSRLQVHIREHVAQVGLVLGQLAERGEELSEDEEHQYYLMFVANMRAWENIHYQYRQGLFDEREFNAEKLAWQLVSNRNEAFSRNWCILHATLSPDFVAELEGLLDDDPCPVVTD